MGNLIQMVGGTAYASIEYPFGQEITDDKVFVVGDLNQVFVVNKATAVALTLPDIGANEIGYWLKLLKRGAGNITVNCGGTDNISDQGGAVATSIANTTSTDTFAHLELIVEANGTWALGSMLGSWSTS